MCSSSTIASSAACFAVLRVGVLTFRRQCGGGGRVVSRIGRSGRSAGGGGEPAGGDSPREDARARRTCRDGSPVLAVVIQFRQEHIEWCNRRWRGRRSGVRQSGRRQPPSTHLFDEECIRQDGISLLPRRNLVAVGHQHGLAGCGQTDILAELAVQPSRANGANPRQVVSGSYHRQSGIQSVLPSGGCPHRGLHGPVSGPFRVDQKRSVLGAVCITVDLRMFI